MNIIVETSPINGKITPDEAKAKIDLLMKTGLVIAAFVEEQDGHWVQIVIKPTDDELERLLDANQLPVEAFAGEDIRGLIAAFNNNQELGTLSKHFESNGDAGAFGKDSAGGPSYGAYQLASYTGAMGNFLRFLKINEPGFAQKLEVAGGDAEARRGTDTFKAAWKELASDPKFLMLQHAFIKATYYDVFVRRVRDQIDLNIDTRSLAVRNVAWSTAVQHGMNNNVFKNALANTDIPEGRAGDEVIIRKVYAERSLVNRYFPRVPGLHNSLRTRFRNEEAAALRMLV